MDKMNRNGFRMLIFTANKDMYVSKMNLICGYLIGELLGGCPD
jgi:hypothetical protein